MQLCFRENTRKPLSFQLYNYTCEECKEELSFVDIKSIHDHLASHQRAASKQVSIHDHLTSHQRTASKQVCDLTLYTNTTAYYHTYVLCDSKAFLCNYKRVAVSRSTIMCFLIFEVHLHTVYMY